MTTKTRFLTGGLAGLAVASAVTLAAPSANAADVADRPCGQAAVPAGFITVIHEPVVTQVPAVTHDEWRWERDVTSYEYEYTRVVTPAYTETDWTRVVPGTVEHLWSHTVVTQAAVPAVPGSPEQGHVDTVVVTPAVTVTMFQYVQQKTGNIQWHEDGWNGEKDDTDNGRGWAKTGVTREDVVTPAVTTEHWVVDHPAVPETPAIPEVSHVDTTWAATSPGADWSDTGDTRTVGGGTESTTTTGDDVPDGDGWTKGATHGHDAVLDTWWALEAPDGYNPTGESRVHGVTTEQTDDTSATAPEGDGWRQVVDSLVTVEDQPARIDLVGGGTEQVQVSPAQPATPPCVAVPAPDGAAVVAGVASHANGNTKGNANGAAGAGTATVAATVLPATGSPVSPVLVAAGLGALLSGGALVRVGRRRTS